MNAFRISLVFLFSLFFRLWISTRLDFGVDQQAIFELGRSFYETGVIPAEGPKLVYTGESIPGGFQAILAGLPLFLSKGDPIGLKVWVGFLNWLSMILLFLWLRKIIKPTAELLLAVFLAFSPWSILFSPAWNPSFLPVLAVPFFMLLERVIQTPDQDQPSSRLKIQAFALGLLVQLCFQLHLSAVLLGVCLLFVVFRIRSRVHFILFSALGFGLGAIFLIPWLLKRWEGAVSAPSGVIGFYPGNLLGAFAAFIRYFSFPTAEISRFIGEQGRGFSGMIDFLMTHPFFMLPALIALSGSGVLVWVSLRYWFRLGFRRLIHKVRLNEFEQIEFWMPVLFPFLFLFSVKGASAHTFWILMPLSFYTVVKSMSEVKFKRMGVRSGMILGYLIASGVLIVAAV